MCGIAGLIDPSEVALEDSLQHMLERMVHRGPDGEGRFVAKDIGLALGMRRLSIIDIEGGAQPIWNEDDMVGVVFNGEIYNYLELRRDLIARGHRFKTASDTEVLVHLYEDKGAEMTASLRGMFAFCIYDRVRNCLFLARDHFGQKPLYYTAAKGRFAFASESKSLLTLPWVDRTLDEDAFLDFAVWGSLPSPRTHYRAIRKLSAGWSLSKQLDCSDARPALFWAYDLTKEPDLTEPAQAAVELDRALEESVRLHLRADVPVGVLLSGGLDSRTVLAFASEAHGEPLHSFSAGFGAADSESGGRRAERATAAVNPSCPRTRPTGSHQGYR